MIYEIYVCETNEVQAICEDNERKARLTMLIIAAENKGYGVSMRRVEGTLNDEKYKGFEPSTQKLNLQTF